MEKYHEPVLLREVLDALKLEKGRWYLDCTLGDGGHSLEILKSGGNVLGIDTDPEAVERARNRFETEEIDRNKWKLVAGNFRDIKNLIKQTDIKGLKFAGAIFDLGVSSLQLETPERGFSFAKNGPLDMRMDPNLKVLALDLVNGLNKGELYELFSKLGEEKNSRSLAEALVSARALRPIVTTRDLAEIIEKSVSRRTKIPPYAKVFGGKHPATRIFQALRIAVNDELNALEEGLVQVKEIIKDGIILVISFHSLEDRIVKLTFKSWESLGLGKTLTKTPVIPSDLEKNENIRSRSAKMRVFMRSYL